MTRSSLPNGYAVAQLANKQWYPLEVSQRYSAEHQEGVYSVLFTLCNLDGEDLFFSTQREAVAECQEQARMNEAIKQRQWEMLACKSDIYPERCAHYISIIEENAGRPPIVIDGYNNVTVHLPSNFCPHCHTVQNGIIVTAITIEHALGEVAEHVYEKWCQCRQMHTAYQELRTA